MASKVSAAGRGGGRNRANRAVDRASDRSRINRTTGRACEGFIVERSGLATTCHGEKKGTRSRKGGIVY